LDAFWCLGVVFIEALGLYGGFLVCMGDFWSVWGFSGVVWGIPHIQLEMRGIPHIDLDMRGIPHIDHITLEKHKVRAKLEK
jgi:hypothetical protein